MTSVRELTPKIMNRSAPMFTGASAPASDVNEEESRRFRLSCRMLRLAGHFDNQLPGQRRGESAIDWLVRLGLAKTPHAAAAALIEGQGLRPALDELLRLSEPF